MVRGSRSGGGDEQDLWVFEQEKLLQRVTFGGEFGEVSHLNQIKGINGGGVTFSSVG